MGHSQAQIFARYGYNVTLYGRSSSSLEKAKKNIEGATENLQTAGKITVAEAEELLARISYTSSKDCFKNFDFMVENITEDLDAKHEFFAELSAAAPKDSIICTNTSGLSINAIAEAVQGRERFIGMHWFNPSNIIPLIEIVRCDETTDEVAETVRQVALTLGKKPVVVNKDVPGFVANRIQFAVLREAQQLVEDGVVSMEGVDDVMRYGLGLRYACLGPLAIADFGGLDTFYHIASYLNADLCNIAEPSKLITEHYEAGEYGVKTGKGFYDYAGRAEQATAERDAAYLAVATALYG